MSKLISRNNIIKYKNPSQKIEQTIHLTDDDLMLMGWQRLYNDNNPNHRQVKDDDPLRKTLDESDWWVGDLLGNLVPKEAVLHYWNTKNAPASNAILEKRWEDEADRLTLLEIGKELQHRKNELFNKDVDTVFVKAPLALLGLGIGGAAALPYLAPGTIGGNIIGTTAFGEALNTAIKYGTGKTMGEHAVEAAHFLGIPQSLWGDFGIQMLGDMPLYVGGDLIGKAVTNTGRILGKEALNQIALNKVQLDPNLINTEYLKDSFGKEIIPTPFPGTDEELSQIAYNSQINVLKDYFTNPQKIEQVKSEMHWGDKEYNEFKNELMRILGIQANVDIKGLQSGFTDIGSSSGKVIGEGVNAEARQKLSLNKDRIANMELALETAIHEIGGHGKTLSIRLNPNDVVSTKFGKWFPRMKQFTEKNKAIADATLELNEKGKLFNNFNSESELKYYLELTNYSPNEINDLLEQYRHFKYATDEQELYARGYASLLMLNLKPTYKTLNLELLEKYYTPESVKKYINSVLSISVPIIGSYGLTQSNKKGGKLIPRKYK